MKSWGLTDTQQHEIVTRADQMCDPGLALRQVLDLLVDANIQNDLEDDYDDDRLDRQASAQTGLFQLACEHAARRGSR